MSKPEPLWKSRTLMTFIALAVVWSMWERYSTILGDLDAEKSASLAAITQTVLWIVGLLVASLAGIKSLEKIFSFRNSVISESISQSIHQVEKIVRPRDHDDGSIP